MPTVPPGATKPPAPEPVMPTAPGGTLPPTATRPPVTTVPTPPIGLAPARPPSGVPPVDSTLVDRSLAAASTTSADCSAAQQAGARTDAAPAGDARRPDCAPTAQDPRTASNQQQDSQVPLTPGRDLPVETAWNAWTEATATRTSDERYGLDNRSSQTNVKFGLDRKLGKDLVAGLSLGPQNGHAKGFQGAMDSDTDGYVLGVYGALRLSANWAADLSFDYTHADSDVRIAVLRGSSTLRSYATSAGLSGQYIVGEWYLRPKLTVTYTDSDSDARAMSGMLGGTPISLYLAGLRSHSGVAEAYGEISRLFSLADGTHMIPYLELGLHREFARANGGRILTGDLTYAAPSPWYGSVRTGLRMQFANNMLMEGSLGYLSLGQNGREVWEGRLRMSIGF